MLSAVLNLVLNIVLIKYFGGIGASVAYLVTTIFQATAYYMVVNKHLMDIPLFTLFRFLGAAAAIFIAVSFIGVPLLLKLLIAILGYMLICLWSGWISIGHFKNMKLYLKK